MSTQRKRRGLFWWGLRLSLLVVVIAIGTVAWWHFRPAMGIERQLVGTWRLSYTDENQQEHAWNLTLTSGRRGVIDGEVSGGKWYMEDNRIHFPDPWYEEVARTLLSSNYDHAFELTFEDEDTVTAHSLLNGMDFLWERVPD